MTGFAPTPLHWMGVLVEIRQAPDAAGNRAEPQWQWLNPWRR